MKTFASAFAIAALSAMAADPSAVVAGMSRDAATGCVTVEYVLDGADAIVTFGGDISPESGVWTTLPESAFRRVAGDVNILVPQGTSRKIVWKPDAADMYGAANGFRARLTLWSPSAPPDFMSAEIGGNKEIRYYTSEDALPYPIVDSYWKSERILFRKVPAKNVVWNMASISSGRFVRLLADYYLGVFPYTKSQAQNVASFSTARLDAIADGADPGFCPEFCLSYSGLRGRAPDDASASYPIVEGCSLSTIRDKVALDVDLPTEAEWEYACRAGCGGALYTGEPATDENVLELAWCAANGRKVNEVGLKRPNAWGFYDMLGNVAEWCLDYYAYGDDGYFADGTVDAPAGPAGARVFGDGMAYRVARGGCFWENGANMALGANYRWGYTYTHSGDPAFGVRLRASIPGAGYAKIENGTSAWQSLDTTVHDGYWDCTAYENPMVVVATGEATGMDFRSGTFAASSAVEPDGMLETRSGTESFGYIGELNSRKFVGASLTFR